VDIGRARQRCGIERVRGGARALVQLVVVLLLLLLALARRRRVRRAGLEPAVAVAADCVALTDSSALGDGLNDGATDGDGTADGVGGHAPVPPGSTTRTRPF
jgi:hypothetical protein